MTATSVTPAQRAWYLEQDERYAHWLDALEGRVGALNANDIMPGYYELTRKTGPSSPVAVWYTGDTLNCLMGDRAVPAQSQYNSDSKIAVWGADELWTRFCKNPISYEVYTAWTKTGVKPGVNAVVAEQVKSSPDSATQTPEAAYKSKVAALVPEGAKFKVITTDEEEREVASIRNRANELGLEGEKKYEAENRPLLDKQKLIRLAWSDPAKEARALAKRLADNLIGPYQTKKRQAAQAAAQKLADEAAALAAASAATAAAAEHAMDGQATSPGPGHNLPPADPVLPVLDPIPQKTQIQAGYGRALNSEAVWEADFTGWEQDKVYEFFKVDPSVTEVLVKLAKRRIADGFEVPGVKRKEGTRIR